MIILVDGQEYVPLVDTDTNGITWALILTPRDLIPAGRLSCNERDVRDFVRIPGALVLHDHDDVDGQLAQKLLDLELIEDLGIVVNVMGRIVNKRVYRSLEERTHHHHHHSG